MQSEHDQCHYHHHNKVILFCKIIYIISFNPLQQTIREAIMYQCLQILLCIRIKWRSYSRDVSDSGSSLKITHQPTPLSSMAHKVVENQLMLCPNSHEAPVSIFVFKIYGQHLYV